MQTLLRKVAFSEKWLRISPFLVKMLTENVSSLLNSNSVAVFFLDILRKFFVLLYFRAYVTAILIHFRSGLYSYRNRSFDLHCKSNDWFPYEMQH